MSVEDVNDSSLTIKWKTPETVGDSGLDGYTVEYCKDGSESVYMCEYVCEALRLHLSPECQRADRLIAGSRPYTAGSTSPAVTVSPDTTFRSARLLR